MKIFVSKVCDMLFPNLGIIENILFWAVGPVCLALQIVSGCLIDKATERKWMGEEQFSHMPLLKKTHTISKVIGIVVYVSWLALIINTFIIWDKIEINSSEPIIHTEKIDEYEIYNIRQLQEMNVEASAYAGLITATTNIVVQDGDYVSFFRINPSTNQYYQDKVPLSTSEFNPTNEMTPRVITYRTRYTFITTMNGKSVESDAIHDNGDIYEYIYYVIIVPAGTFTNESADL